VTADLRVLQLVQKPQRRGAEVFAADLARQLRSSGCRVMTVYLYPHDGGAPLELGPDDVVLEGVETHPLERLTGVHPGLLRRLTATVADFRPDVVQANGARTVKYAALCKLMTRGRWALVYRNIGDPAAWVKGWRERLFYRRLVMPRIDAVVGVSEFTLAGVRERWGVRGPVIRVPRAIDAEAYVARERADVVRAALGTPVAAPVVLWVGSLSAEKRPDRMLRVAATVRASSPELRVWIAGDGPLTETVAADAARAGGWVSLLGARADVADLMGAADVLVLTSDTEGTPGVVLEAGAARLPVVATRVGGVADCVIDGTTGVLADPDDEAGLAHAVAALLADEPLRRRMGEQAQSHVIRHFSLAAAAQAYVTLYRSVALGGDAAPIDGAKC
jgi:glycosyltransferase involved in cell wall biosynthesis